MCSLCVLPCVWGLCGGSGVRIVLPLRRIERSRPSVRRRGERGHCCGPDECRRCLGKIDSVGGGSTETTAWPLRLWPRPNPCSEGLNVSILMVWHLYAPHDGCNGWLLLSKEVLDENRQGSVFIMVPNATLWLKAECLEIKAAKVVAGQASSQVSETFLSLLPSYCMK